MGWECSTLLGSFVLGELAVGKDMLMERKRGVVEEARECLAEK